MAPGFSTSTSVTALRVFTHINGKDVILDDKAIQRPYIELDSSSHDDVRLRNPLEICEY